MLFAISTTLLVLKLSFLLLLSHRLRRSCAPSTNISTRRHIVPDNVSFASHCESPPVGHWNGLRYLVCVRACVCVRECLKELSVLYLLYATVSPRTESAQYFKVGDQLSDSSVCIFHCPFLQCFPSRHTSSLYIT